MGGVQPGKRLKKSTLARMTPEEIKERARKMNAARTARWKAKQTASTKSALYERDCARCVDRAGLEAQVVKEPGTGCWAWTGPWKRLFQRAAPDMRAGSRGHMEAGRAMYLAVHGGTIPARWSVARTCGRAECIAPSHLVLESPTLRAAKRRDRGGSHGEEDEGLRVRAGRDEPGDDRRCG